jgi:hypothetical protein
VHSGEYLAEKLSEITDSLRITNAISSVTRDNASSNNSMLDEFESLAEDYKRSHPDDAYQPWSFTRKEGDIRCLGHVINLAVQDAITQLKATPSDVSETYRMTANEAQLPYTHRQDEVVSAFSKLRRHVYIFRNRRQFKSQLEQQLRATGMKPKLLTLDMPVRWNSTYEMLNTACSQEGPITAVCASQTIDLSIREIMLSHSDWAILHKLLQFFLIFVHPSRKLQASHYPSLNYAIPQYLKLIRKVSEKQSEWGPGTPLGIACQKSLDKLTEYFTESLNHPCASVATICDPRFNVNIFNIMLNPGHQDNLKKAKIKGHFRTCFSQYQEREAEIKRVKFIREQQDAPETQEDSEGEESDAELYRKGPIDPDPDTEVTKYFRQQVMPRETDIYQFWKAKQFEFPIIAKMAKDFLPMPATSSPSEVVFSAGGDIITKKRNRLVGESVRMIICLKAWGIILEEDLVEEDTNVD